MNKNLLALLICLILLLLSGCNDNATTKGESRRIYSNNSGIATYDGTNTYYSDYEYFFFEDSDSFTCSKKRQNKLNKLEEGSDTLFKLGEIVAQQLIYHDEWIYYVNCSDDYKIYKIRTDGFNNQELIDYPVGQTQYFYVTNFLLASSTDSEVAPHYSSHSMSIYKDKLYFISNNNLFSADLDGKDIEMIISEVYNFFINEDTIYATRYSNDSENKSILISKDLGGNSTEDLLKTSIIRNLVVDNEAVFFIEDSNNVNYGMVNEFNDQFTYLKNKNLKKYDLENKLTTNMIEDISAFLIIDNNIICNYNGISIIDMSDGTLKTIVESSDVFYDFNLAGDWIYCYRFKDIWNDDKITDKYRYSSVPQLFKVKIDGSQAWNIDDQSIIQETENDSKLNLVYDFTEIETKYSFSYPKQWFVNISSYMPGRGRYIIPKDEPFFGSIHGYYAEKEQNNNDRIKNIIRAYKENDTFENVIVNEITTNQGLIGVFIETQVTGQIGAVSSIPENLSYKYKCEFYLPYKDFNYWFIFDFKDKAVFEKYREDIIEIAKEMKILSAG